MKLKLCVVVLCLVPTWPLIAQDQRTPLIDEIARWRSYPPRAPVLNLPASAATSQPIATVLSWAPTPGATSYDIHIGTTSTPLKVGTVLSTSYTTSLLPDTQYYWKIVARNAYSTASSTTRTFRTVATAPPPPPPPINCVLSEWSAWSPWTPIPSTITTPTIRGVNEAFLVQADHNGVNTSTYQLYRTTSQRTHTRTITTQPANGGTPCLALTEVETDRVLVQTQPVANLKGGVISFAFPTGMQVGRYLFHASANGTMSAPALLVVQ